jgi:hypothetical protein
VDVPAAPRLLPLPLLRRRLLLLRPVLMLLVSGTAQLQPKRPAPLPSKPADECAAANQGKRRAPQPQGSTWIMKPSTARKKLVPL